MLPLSRSAERTHLPIHTRSHTSENNIQTDGRNVINRSLWCDVEFDFLSFGSS